MQHLLAKFGVTHTLLSIEDLAGIERVLRQTPTRLLVFESPTNPVTKIADIEHLTTHARRAGCLTVLDNTFAGFHNHGAYDIDIFLHSLTKYASGHGDVMGGAIIAHRPLIAKMRKDVVTMGPTLDPHAAFLIQRGMRTYFLRYERQCASALAASRFLSVSSAGEACLLSGVSTLTRSTSSRNAKPGTSGQWSASSWTAAMSRAPASPRHCSIFHFSERGLFRVTGDATAVTGQQRVYRRAARRPR